MTRVRFLLSLAGCAGLALAAQPARAIFDLWEIREAFSNADGSVQFIEMSTIFGSQQFVGGHSIVTSINNFTFPSNSPSPTNNKNLLLATAGFGDLAGGVTANFTIPSQFFDTAGDTINFVGADIVTFASAPTDGINAVQFTVAGVASTAVNSPTNFAGTSGEVDLSVAAPTGDYNGNGIVGPEDYDLWKATFGSTMILDADGNGDGTVGAADYTVWRDTLGQSVAMMGDGADGDQSGTIDAADYDFWKANFGNTLGAGAASSATVPEPSTTALAFFAWLILCGFSRRVGCREPRTGQVVCVRSGDITGRVIDSARCPMTFSFTHSRPACLSAVAA